jgi:predicted Ser/Thr protein kinase
MIGLTPMGLRGEPTPVPANHPVLIETAEWDRAVEKLIGRGAELASVSRWIGDARVYVIGDRVVKIRRLGIARPEGVRSLAAEAAILERLGVAVEASSDADWETMSLPRFAGTPLNIALAGSPLPRRLRTLARVARSTRKLHRRGIAHRDLRPDNILLDNADAPLLIDYDRAAVLSPWRAAVADWIGPGPLGMSPYPLWKVGLVVIAPRTASLARRIMRLARVHSPVSLSRARDPVDTELDIAWQLAAASPANAAGQGLAYYAFTYRGRHYVGERPWYLRWDAVRQHVDFRGRTVVELGCNMGLLSTFAMVYGAAAATGVDWDLNILDAARKTATAMGVAPKFERVNLADDSDWEGRLGNADIVIAMSILHWVSDKRRLLSFVGTHREVIFEGHDSSEVETERLRGLGFDDVRVICRTERGRAVLHARRTDPGSTPEA